MLKYTQISKWHAYPFEGRRDLVVPVNLLRPALDREMEGCMFIQSARRKSDPVTMFGMLARSALERFDMQGDEPVRFREVYFNNLIRLLEMYRYDALRDHNPQGILERQDLTDLEAALQNDIGLDTLNGIFDSARRACYPNFDKHQLVDHLREILEQIRQEGSGSVDKDDLTKVEQFLTQLQQTA